MQKVWKWIDHNRFIVIAPLAGLLIWLAAFGCIPETPSPLDPTRTLTPAELETEFKVWQLAQEQTMLKFEAGRADIEKQKAAWGEFQEILMSLATGSVADWGGLVQLVVGGGLLGALGDNVRKRGLIAGLKRNK